MNWSGTTVGALLTIISAMGFSTLSIFGVVAYHNGVNLVTALGGRFLTAAIVLWGYMLLTRTPLPDRKTVLQLFLLGGVGYATMSTLFLASVDANRLSPALAGLLLYTHPAIVTLLSWWTERQRPTAQQAGALTLATIGAAFVLLAPGAGTIFTPTGALLALSSAFVYSAYILYGNHVIKKSTPVAATAYVSASAAAVFLGYGALTGKLVAPTIPGGLALVGMGLAATALAVMLFFAGMKRLGPSKTSIISTLEPVGTVLLSALVFGDRPGAGQLAGGALVLGGVLWLQMGKRSSPLSES